MRTDGWYLLRLFWLDDIFVKVLKYLESYSIFCTKISTFLPCFNLFKITDVVPSVMTFSCWILYPNRCIQIVISLTSRLEPDLGLKFGQFSWLNMRTRPGSFPFLLYSNLSSCKWCLSWNSSILRGITSPVRKYVYSIVF